jgi:hypothetical protein
MTKYLYGRVTVETLEVVAKNPEKAEEQAAELFKLEGKDQVKTAYIFCWSEGGIMDTTVERNLALGAFLELMQKVIPLTPSEKGLILLDGGITPQRRINIVRFSPPFEPSPPPDKGLPGDRPSPRVG